MDRPPPHHLRPHYTPAVWGQRLRLTESDKLQVQIQAYLDNVFDVGTLLEETETKNAVLEHMEELQEQVATVRAAHNLVRHTVGPQEGCPGVGSSCAASTEWKAEFWVWTGSSSLPEFALNPNPASFWYLSQ